MLEIKKNIEECTCPCCGVRLDGLFYGQQKTFKYADGSIFEKFDFNCPKKNRRICLLESNSLTNKIFWLVEQESILEKYKVFQKTALSKVNLVIFYLYFPYNMKLDFEDSIQSKLKEFKKTSALGLVYPVYLKDKFSKYRSYVDIEWVLDDKMFSYCKGTIYNSILAEANILNESEKWLRCKLLSNYPTMYSNFECFMEVDLEKLKQTIV